MLLRFYDAIFVLGREWLGGHKYLQVMQILRGESNFEIVCDKTAGLKVIYDGKFSP